ncbi:MAG: HD domain-containing protein [Desulfobacterales bacterium]|nr:HD domain-containing protein [Desulfobacterales bacterium]
MEKFEDAVLNEITVALNRREENIFNPLAAFSHDAQRRLNDDRLESDYRQAYAIDTDRVMHSMAYTRYIDKTQVFSLIEHDHITHRVLHVQFVSKIARTIGRFLGLNEDLIEAIALGHDIGHTPFGHDGERFLSELCRSHGIGYFLHNVQSVQFLDRVERDGRGWNLCLQTLDGILCHDGEVHNQMLKPERDKSFEDFDRLMEAKKASPATALVPMTMEGCVVRMADTISYIGRDIEDAIRLNIIKRSDLPEDCVDILGNTNGKIVYTLVTDVIRNSYRKISIAFSPEVSDALKKLKLFNMERIYLNAEIKKYTSAIKQLFGILFEKFFEDLEKENRSSVIFTGFLGNMSELYTEMFSSAEIVRDFIAGMTDHYFLRQFPENMRPQPIVC